MKPHCETGILLPCGNTPAYVHKPYITQILKGIIEAKEYLVNR